MKIYTLFQTKSAWKPYPKGRYISIWSFSGRSDTGGGGLEVWSGFDSNNDKSYISSLTCNHCLYVPTEISDGAQAASNQWARVTGQLPAARRSTNAGQKHECKFSNSNKNSVFEALDKRESLKIVSCFGRDQPTASISATHLDRALDSDILWNLSCGVNINILQGICYYFSVIGLPVGAGTPYRTLKEGPGRLTPNIFRIFPSSL